jgi:hypothetical protein
MSPEQYRAKFGREPALPETKTEPWPDAAGWQGWTMPWPPPTVVAVMAEWTDVFLWNRSPAPDRALWADDYVLDPEVLGVSPRLTERLRAWNDRYSVDAAKSAWVEEGWALAHDLQRESDGRGLAVEVRYHDSDGQERPVSGHPRRRTRG